jgi:hypothetical protein
VFLRGGDVHTPSARRSDESQDEARDLRRGLAAAAADECRDASPRILDELPLLRMAGAKDPLGDIGGPELIGWSQGGMSLLTDEVLQDSRPSLPSRS